MNDNWGFSDEELDGLFRQAADGQRPRFEPEDWRRMAARLDEAGRDGLLPPPRVPWYRRWGWLGLAGLLLLTGLAVWMLPAPDRIDGGRAPVAPAGRAEGNEPAPTRPGTAERAGEPNAASRAGSSAEAEGASVASGLRGSETSPSPLGKDDPKAERKTTSLGGETPGKGTVSASLGKKSAEPERRPSEDLAAGRGRGTPTDQAEVIAGKALFPRKETRRVPANAAPERTADNAEATRGTTRPRPTQTATPNRRVRETDTAPPVVHAGRRSGEPGGTKPRMQAERTADFGKQPEALKQKRTTWAQNSVPENAPQAAPERWQTPDLVRLNPRRVSLRQINLPVEEPSLGQFSAYYTPPARRAEVLPRGRFGVRALLAPDLNAVSTMRTFAYGRSLGLLAEYEFLPRWRVQAGAIRSQKDYTSTPDDYTPPTPGYWARWGKPETIDARCAILDIPLNVRFDAVRRSRHDLFVSTGLSTYVMLDEFYDYHYSYKPMYTHAVHRGGRHLASTLNFSAGYERQLGAGFSLQVEPYLKLPLAGVGWGSVRLYSTGLHLSLGFHRVR